MEYKKKIEKIEKSIVRKSSDKKFLEKKPKNKTFVKSPNENATENKILSFRFFPKNYDFISKTFFRELFGGYQMEYLQYIKCMSKQYSAKQELRL